MPKKTKKKTKPIISPPASEPVISTPSPEPVPQTKNAKKKQQHTDTHAATKQRQAYSQTVYTSRFTHFRVLRIASFGVGICILIMLSFGLWKLYRTVFDTIAQTENLFFVQQTKRTDIINFATLEEVRDAWHAKYDEIATSTPRAIFGDVAPVTLDTTDTEVEE
ncbi:MAG: hypothetical protein CO030_02035 [Candidatus Magasanikbacteria bacterium CG_4_9_14_0_2_um_filter_42_11]|uniref:Uncharacterized protein n=1 Tax=Candidatus Magasanikbacteria bacterium CG_4_9_14_0_2_um_filter_42_11 TaxID=1974643 RepID=A0A2M8FA32_9BACT|nr:MAG: hypothetical protein COU34_00125 [Candidatus Magasanikbacteria bacterium CG10_big_fil_rev_8_21_14_0_10_43_9]PIY92774.1 MAG: hypothetical protein COY70_01465 [Candidatus Magasanikbacteria bacterium CG_4_10_14_0_8_um_filter_42_12]PJC52593.1 MAG: hypothetical protein CO030_02035 [Candidatus Magasanikbacteria bacterium CG_4_9_14_0_2_um_filter_42_11]